MNGDLASALAHPVHRPPNECPVCRQNLAITRLGCPACGTELSGAFRQCAFCRLSEEDLETLRVFLVSRGNMREVERHLGVSYPTARQRFTELLIRLGMDDGKGDVDLPVTKVTSVIVGQERDRILRDLADGRIGVEDAEAALRGSTVAPQTKAEEPA
jgi:hypothetical protein